LMPRLRYLFLSCVVGAMYPEAPGTVGKH
jgi:hypothetical protein